MKKVILWAVTAFVFAVVTVWSLLSGYSAPSPPAWSILLFCLSWLGATGSWFRTTSAYKTWKLNRSEPLRK
jgi:hypothetical protein